MKLVGAFLPLYVVLYHGVHAQHLPQFLTGYGWHAASGDAGNWTTLCSSPSLREIRDAFQQYGLPCMYEAADVFFESITVVNASLQGLTLRPDAAARWANASAEVAPFIANGTVTVIMLGDELVWNNITWDELNYVSDLVRASFPRPAHADVAASASPLIYYNEGYVLVSQRNCNGFRSPYPYLPSAIDVWSLDDYLSQARAQYLYEHELYPRMNTTTQRVMVVPLTSGNPTLPACNLTCLDAYVYNETLAYWAWAQADALIVGINMFHLSTYGPTDVGVVSLPQSLALYESIGEQIRRAAQ